MQTHAYPQYEQNKNNVHTTSIINSGYENFRCFNFHDID